MYTEFLIFFRGGGGQDGISQRREWVIFQCPRSAKLVYPPPFGCLWIYFCQKYFRFPHDFFLAEKFLVPKKLFETEKFWTQNFFQPQIFFNPKFFGGTKYFLPKNSFGSNFFFWSKNAFWPKIFFSFDPKFCLTPNIFEPLIFLAKIYIFTKMFFPDTNIFFTKIFFWTKYFWHSKIRIRKKVRAEKSSDQRKSRTFFLQIFLSSHRSSYATNLVDH